MDGIRFQNTSPSDRITATPRALFRVVVARDAGAFLSYLSGVLNWRTEVQKIIDAGNPAAYPLGGAADAVLATDRVATLDYVAKSSASASVTVADMVNALNAASKYAHVVSVARVGYVPPTSEGGADKLAADREATQQKEREISETTGITGALRSVRSVLVLAVVVGAAIAAYRLFPSKASTGK